ncbi:hypothetical protein ACSBR2_013460 [Camellia fascicularis]
MAKRLTVLCTALVWCFYFCNIPATTPVANNETDRVALLAFKATIVEDPFGALSSWNHSLHFCLWNGILCSRRHRDRVIGLNLTSQGLVGLLSPHIGNLSFLKSIILQNNSFHGPIPQEMGRLFRLQTIEFGYHLFGGGIPNNLSRCSRLERLNFTHNNLTGNIPAKFGSLSRLGALSLSKNKLFGTIPPFIGNLSSLSILDLLECNLHGEIPAEIARLRGLAFVHLSLNHLSGKVPSGLYNISTINLLAVTMNLLEGNIPPDIGSTLPNLKLLYFCANFFTGTIPTSLSNASDLESIELCVNDFSGTMPRDLGKLLGLRRIALYNNRLQDDPTFTASLTNCSSLQYISAAKNSFMLCLVGGFWEGFGKGNGKALEGSLPDSIANLSMYLSIIKLQNNQIHGSIPSGIGNLFNLNLLSMAVNNLVGPIPSSIGRLHKLQELLLGGNKFTELPSALGNLTSLIILTFEVNNIHGSIPPSLGNCHSLLELALSQNNLNGSIHPEIISLSSISTSLKLDHNALTDSLPLEVGSSKNLGYMDMAVAVKVLNLQTRGASRSFMTECKALRAIRHQNLLKILSVCSSVDFNGDEFKALVYEFMANGNLDKWLHQVGVGDHGQQEEPKNLKLIHRLDISTDVASALKYLHCGCESTIIHGDLKPSNVLLDDEMAAHIGDFGLAKIISTVSSDVAQGQSNSVAIRGTIGYVAPGTKSFQFP